MKRDISNIFRDLEDKKNNDIIRKKYLIEKMFNEDPDLNELLGKKENVNNELDKKRIIPYMKLNGIQKETSNFIMFDIDDDDVSYTNNIIKNQMLIVMCLVHEDDMETEYGILRTDLLGYIVKDLLCWSNALGMQIKCIKDFSDIIDSRYYSRTLKFKIEVPNHTYYGVNNKYDKFQRI